MTSPLPDYRLVRSRRRTLALVIDTDGTLTVRAPLKLANSAIQEFLAQKADWVLRTQSKLKARAAQRPSHTFETGDSFLWLGQFIPLTLVPAQRPALQFDGLRFTLSQKAQVNAKTYFEAWYKEQARGYLQSRLDHFARLHHFSYRGLRITSARTRWGSCNSKNELAFAWRLLMAPPEVVDYVVVHELAHTVHHNHGPKFWKLVGDILPDCKVHVRWLKEHGNKLHLE
ncbi:MAG: M48 family metallopeptidase [Chloroflexi bacterium]|nr:M48 family metallopeptidase [Chloroflexota bacterium]